MRWRAFLTFADVWLRTGWTVFAGMLGALIAVGGLISGSTPLTTGGLLLAVVATLATASDLIHVRREMSDLYIQPTNIDWLALSLDPPYDSDELLEMRHGAALLDDARCERLATLTRLPVKMCADEYRLPRIVSWALNKAIVEAWRSGRRDFDAPKVRLMSDLNPVEVDPPPVELQKTRFVFAGITNDLAARAYRSRRERVERLGPTSVPFPEMRLPDLGHSLCSNHVGVDTLVFLRTGHLVLGVQSAHNAQSPGLLSASGSGSSDWNDLISLARPDFLAFLKRAMCRELREECGVSTQQVDEQGTIIVGFARLLHRGGKPQFFGWTPAAITEHDVHRSQVEKRYVDDHLFVPLDWSSPIDWSRSLRNFLQREEAWLSAPLHLNVELLVRWAERDPARWDEIRASTSP